MNTSGIHPLDNRVLVLPDPVSEKIGSIIIPDAEKERNKFAQMKATLIAIGANAWSEARRESAVFVPPVPGDRILISKYGGILLTGDDGKDYRILNDEDVTALLLGEGANG
jgi:co-chaperonin GroES (HSP10)